MMSPGEAFVDITEGMEPGCAFMTGTVTDHGNGGTVSTTDQGAIRIDFTPTARVLYTCTFTFRGTANANLGTFVVNATGTGPALTTTPDTFFMMSDTRVAGGVTTTNLHIQNSGNGGNNLAISSIAFTNGTEFSYSGSIPASLAPGASFDLTVAFNPTMAGPRSDVLTISSNAIGQATKTIMFQGNGTAALIAVGDATFPMTQGGMTTTADISITNTAPALGQDILQITSGTIMQSSTWFSFDTNGSSSCGGLTTCTLNNTFANTTVRMRCSPPAGASGTQTAMVMFSSNSDPGGDNTAMLSCNSGRPDIMVTPLTIPFGNQQVSTTSAPMTFMISSVGTSTLTYSVGATAAPFARSATCTSNCTLPAGMSTTVSVTFSPTTTGPANGSIIVTSDDADVADRSKTVTLSGTGTAPQISVASPLDFMNVEVGANSSLPLTAMNTGTAPLDISSATLTSGAANFTVTAGMAGAQQVAVNGSATWTIRCNPSTSGMLTGNFRIVSNSFTGATTNVTLTCNGQQGSLATTPATTVGTPLDLGGVTVGATSTQMFTLRNPGNVAVTGITGMLAPANVGYSIDPTTPIPTMLAAGGSAVIKVIFAPQAGTDGGPATIVFSGTWGAAHTTTVTLFLTGDGLTAGYDVTTIPSTSPPAINFGSLRFDTTATGTFCIVNTEQTPVTIQNPITITPNAPTTTGELAVTGVKRNSTCTTTGGTTATLPQTLNQNEVLVVTVTADPANRTGLLSGTATVTSNLLMNPTRTIALTGMSTSAMLTTTPGMLVDFGDVDRDGPPAMRTITIMNTGDGPMDLSGFARNPMNGPFTFTLPSSQQLAAGGKVDIVVTYTPVVEQAPNQSEQVIISHNISGVLNGPASQMITVRGRGVDRHIALDAAPTFPDTFRNPGAAAPVRTVTVRNTGEAPLNITALMLTNDDVWQLVDMNPFTVASKSSHDVMVRFVPKVAGKAPVGQLTFMNNDNSTPTPMAVVLLNGNGIDRGVIMGDPEIDLGQTAIGIPVTLSDVLTVTSMDPTNGFKIRSITLDDDTTFSIEEAPMDVSLAANTTMKFSVTFTPTTEGAFETRAHLFLDEDPTAQADVILKGQGVFVDVSGGGGCSTSGGGAGGAMVLLVGLLAVRRRRAASTAALAALAITLLMPAAGRADPNFDLDLSLFNPTPATTGNGFQVQPASVGDNGQFAAAATVSYATNPLVLKFAGSEHMAITQRTTIELGAAYAFLGRFEAGARMPLYNQAGDGAMVGVASPSGTARGDLVAHVKAQLAKVKNGGGTLFAGATLAVTIPTATREEFAGVDGPTGRVLGLLSFTPTAIAGRLALTANAGAVVRKKQSLSNIDQGSGAVWGVGGSFRAADALWLTLEMFGEVLPSARKDSPMGSAGLLTPTEALLGVQYRAGGSFSVGVAVGRGVVAGIGTPDLRGVFALSFVPGNEAPAPLKPPPPPRVEKDADGDGILDEADKCPNEAEDKDLFDDTDGCPDPDNDGDGFADAQDKCPLDAEDKDGFQDDDGCPEKDNDADGIPDTQDKCPMEPEDKDGAQDIDGCPDPDNDGDGIEDAKDMCPNEAEIINGNTDDDGCPDRGDALVIVTPSSLDTMEGMQFTGNTVSKASTNLMNQIGATLRAHAEIVRIKVVVHVQPTNDPEKDQERSDKRAQAVRDGLVQFGIAVNRISAIGLGGTKPLVPKNAKNAALLNDRIELIILERK